MITRTTLAASIVFVTAIGAHALRAQSTATVSLDPTKPFVYIKFDHAGPRQRVEDGEPDQGLWLRLVNNSILPVEVRVNAAATDPEMTLLPDYVTPRIIPIPKSGSSSHETMPRGYSFHVSTLTTIDPGKDILFSVPVNHVRPGWFLQVPFQLVLAPVQAGVQPVCLAPFNWENIPAAQRTDDTLRAIPRPKSPATSRTPR